MQYTVYILLPFEGHKGHKKDRHEETWQLLLRQFLFLFLQILTVYFNSLCVLKLYLTPFFPFSFFFPLFPFSNLFPWTWLKQSHMTEGCYDQCSVKLCRSFVLQIVDTLLLPLTVDLRIHGVAAAAEWHLCQPSWSSCGRWKACQMSHCETIMESFSEKWANTDPITGLSWCWCWTKNTELVEANKGATKLLLKTKIYNFRPFGYLFPLLGTKESTCKCSTITQEETYKAWLSRSDIWYKYQTNIQYWHWVSVWYQTKKRPDQISS